MRRIDLLITSSRRSTQNVDFTDDTGIQDDQFLEHFNAAQERIFSLILQEHPAIFLKEKVITAVVNQQEYTLPADLYMGTRVEKVEYSRTGLEANYFPLERRTLRERFQGASGVPNAYLQRNSTIISQPAPSGAGSFRVTYQQSLPRLEKRRATVAAVTLDTTTLQVTALTLDPTSLTTDVITKILSEGYISLVDKDGAIQMKGIPVTAINSTTGDCTIDTFTYESTETAAVGNYACLGKYSTTHSGLPDTCERYLLSYTNWKILRDDSSGDSVEQNAELQMIENEIVQAYAEADFDVHGVPIISSDFLMYDN